MTIRAASRTGAGSEHYIRRHETLEIPTVNRREREDKSRSRNTFETLATKEAGLTFGVETDDDDGTYTPVPPQLRQV